MKAVEKVDHESIPLKTTTRLYLIKHHLFTKTKKSQLIRVVEDICGLHAQVPKTPYFSLWARVEDFENALLDKALYEDKTLVKVWCMRGTLHIIPSKSMPVYNKALKRMWFEHHGRFMRAPEWPSIEERKNVIYPRIAEALAQEPLKRKELDDKVRLLLRNASLPYERLFSGWGGILKETGYEGITVHAQPCGRESCFARLDKWLPDVDLGRINEEKAQERLLLSYLKGYGPATLQDFSLWSGMMAGDAKKTAENAGSRLEEIRVEGSKGRFFMLKEDRKSLDAIDLDERAPPCLLPKFDSILLGHKDRTRIIPDERKKQVFKSKVGDVAATVLVDGRIVGTWRQKKTKKALTITVSTFEKISSDDLKEVEEKAKALSLYLGLDELRFSVTP